MPASRLFQITSLLVFFVLVCFATSDLQATKAKLPGLTVRDLDGTWQSANGNSLYTFYFSKGHPSYFIWTGSGDEIRSCKEESIIINDRKIKMVFSCPYAKSENISVRVDGEGWSGGELSGMEVVIRIDYRNDLKLLFFKNEVIPSIKAKGEKVNAIIKSLNN